MAEKRPVILFVHIPKTAGTSLRSGLLQLFARRDMLFDYGPDAVETDECLRLLHGRKPFSVTRVAELVAEEGVKVLCGHFPYGRYAQALPGARVVSFVREPLQRCYSEFLHFQRFYGYGNSFEEFFNTPQRINLQSKWLAGVDDTALLGVSEQYGRSLRMINQALGLAVPAMFLNTHRPDTAAPYPLALIGKEVADRFYALNQEDVLLHRHLFSCLAVEQAVGFSFRQSLSRLKQRWCSWRMPRRR
jgi:hypothetical protein